MAFDPSGSFVEYRIRVDTLEAATSVSELNRLLTTYVALARRAGLEGDIMTALAKLQQLRIAIQTTYQSLLLLYTASGPIGWLIGLGGVAMGGLMTADVLGGSSGTSSLERELRSRRWGH